MTLVEAPPHVAARPTASRAAVVATGAALAGSAGWLVTHDPSAPGAHFPGCPFHAVTGLWCPACGLTRGTYHLLHGDVAAAISSNVFTPLVVVAAVVAWWCWARRAFARPVRWRMAERLPGWWNEALAVVLIAYGVARNLPLAWSRALAP